jgi:hypothetical protein
MRNQIKSVESSNLVKLSPEEEEFQKWGNPIDKIIFLGNVKPCQIDFIYSKVIDFLLDTKFEYKVMHGKSYKCADSVRIY